jgi:hypothetical protein
MIEIKVNLIFLQVPSSYPTNMVTELYLYFYDPLQIILLTCMICTSSTVTSCTNYQIHTISFATWSYIIQNLKIINLTHIISILNFVFTVVFYATRWIKLYLNYICSEEFLNQLNLFYIYICIYLQQDKSYESRWANETHYELWLLSKLKWYT